MKLAQEVRIFVVASSVMFSFAKQLILKWPVVITCFNCYLVFTAMLGVFPKKKYLRLLVIKADNGVQIKIFTNWLKQFANIANWLNPDCPHLKTGQAECTYFSNDKNGPFMSGILARKLSLHLFSCHFLLQIFRHSILFFIISTRRPDPDKYRDFSSFLTYINFYVKWRSAFS